MTISGGEHIGSTDCDIHR